jgi:NitT/TauT family transport system substrate-binding protein
LLNEESGVDAENELLTGAVHGVIGFYDHCITLQARGNFVLSVVQLGQTPGEVELVSTKIPGTTSLLNLKGMKLGVTGLGSSTNHLTQYLMREAGMGPRDYAIVPVGAGASFAAAMRQGQIVAGMTTEPTISALVESGDARVLIDMKSVEGAAVVFGGPYPSASLYMSQAWVEQNSASVQKLVNALVRALRFIHGHSAADIIARLPTDNAPGRSAIPIRVLEAEKSVFTQDGLMPVSGPETVLRVLSSVSKAVKDRNVDLSRTFTTEFVRRASAY